MEARLLMDSMEITSLIPARLPLAIIPEGVGSFVYEVQSSITKESAQQ